MAELCCQGTSLALAFLSEKVCWEWSGVVPDNCIFFVSSEV